MFTKQNHTYPNQGMAKQILKWVLLPIAIALISGCSMVGPDYTPPEKELITHWQLQDDPALLPDAKLIVQWWELFNDPLLDQLIITASQNNIDLLTAVARVDETRSRLGIVSKDALPSVDIQADVTRNRVSENSISGNYVETIYAPGISAGWEIDLFGRIRRSVESATAQYEASQEDRTDVMITIYSHVSLAYLDIRTTQARLAAAHANIVSQNEMLDLVRSRFTHGLATDLDIAQAERLLARAEAEVPPLNIALSQAINNLSVLLGQQPGSLHQMLVDSRPIPLPPERATVGVPADLLRQRPDIRRAERELAAQTAMIGVATADLYPSFTLNGSLGFESINTSDLFDAGSKVFSLGPSLRWNIFSRDRIRNQIKVQDALTRQRLLAYEYAILNGLREVENNLKAYIEDRVRLTALERSVDAAKRSVKLASDLYKKGLSDFQPVLDAQRDQFNYENQLASARGNASANFVRLYAALGGGWDPASAKYANLQIKY
ncbi:MAG: efflux transporter outer membrane subunit [Desulfobacterales bacterium]|nr:efflux transporter outer membrane subunit [Desulfobacterales bacterium]